MKSQFLQKEKYKRNIKEKYNNKSVKNIIVKVCKENI